MNSTDAAALARERYHAASHLLTVTYPLINDPKLLIGIINNITTALEAALDAILLHGRERQTIPLYNTTLLGKVACFRENLMPWQEISSKYVNLLLDLKKVEELHQKSPVEFSRRGNFIICGKEYDLTTISPKDIKEYLKLTGEFLQAMERIVPR
ncbi:hypothetical protein COV20_04550 [Candidatus Woesearchaeota archaeon CG10_big_fil_rev_8_21_14_0_10_45_16]|nr:MAG: hypothetical protein COV20_04550 [Candidatus Woesearchaeota archaeon CG10_big_fil_rev_8_21_14_0_10_45_16]